ncbi:hypothetical protein [Sphingomonas sp. OK281]|jgi:hypothetical protein|uniref:hypothetical protein n=1 Tax=Sphingomonas sp. OK281 TaxID=1881067 RepID=UPI0008E6A53F|nr:hypothetical protein [Sphingomonas sp. OK281]RYD25358.1 MAG: hypothetical protein EOP89_09365 [Xanthomonadaceae bacterium]SFO34850.1 hypothetical protein SAMN05428984_3548 [Sphingomonas sp. OK281]
MTKAPDEALRAVTDRVIELEEELEASGVATIDGSELEWSRAALHKWVDDVVGVVVSPGLGRVTVIHPGGKRSSIASSTLPYLMSKPL